MRTFILLIMFLSFIGSEAFATRSNVQGGFLLKGDLRSYYKIQNNYPKLPIKGDFFDLFGIQWLAGGIMKYIRYSIKNSI